DFSYRPGEPLGDYLVHVDFDKPPDHPSFEVNHHGYRLRESPCWQGPGAPGCLDCHDPHAKLSPTEIQTRTRDTCLSCHESMDCNVEEVMQIPQAEAQDCARCHMPSRFSSDAIHIEVTDHLIQKPISDEERLGPAADIPPPTAFEARVNEPQRFDVEAHVRNWEIMGEIIGNKSSNVDALDAGLAETDATAAEQLVLAQGYIDADRADDARRVLEQISTEHPDVAMAQKNLAKLEFDAGEPAQARQRLEKLIESDPDDAAAHQLRAAVLQSEGRIDEAIAALERSIALRGTDPAPLAQLGLLLASTGRFGDAIPALQRAEALAPGNPSTAYNLGLALWKAERQAEAARVWNHALTRSPNAPRLLQAAGITQSLPWPDLELDPTRGVELARRLLQGQAASPDAMLLLAAASLAAGDHPTAAEALNRASQMKADLGAIRLMQSMLIAELGNEAQGYELYQRVRPNITQLNMLRQGLLNRAGIVFDAP
ncbi:MAG: tetratricopeptide repeat protein, partial [Phycisphaerales bacterium]|nr:tetratricopeptide repeat protein [Phycisphaerales bacterium]